MNEKIKDWYLGEKYKPLSWELLKCIRNHESAFIGVEGTEAEEVRNRWYTLGRIGFLRNQLKERFGKGKNQYHFFRSVEYVRFTDRDGNRNNLKNTWDTYGWDFIIDLDGTEGDIGERVEEAKKECEKVKGYFDDKNVPYYLKFSGRKGFHITVPWKYKKNKNEVPVLKKYFEPDDYGTVTKKLGAFLIDKCDINEEVIDTGVWSKSKDLYRIPYSLHPESMKVVLPLTDEQFEKFSLDMVEPEFVKDRLKIKRRGLKVRDGSLEGFMGDFREYSDIDEYEKEKQERKVELSSKVDEIVNLYEGLPTKYKHEVRRRMDG